MPITITDVAVNFQLVCEHAKASEKTKLTDLVNTTKTVNFFYGTETPIERLAFEGDTVAVQFLLNNFNGNLHYALRGYASANNVPIVDTILRLGGSLNYAVQGYAYAGNVNAVDALIKLGAGKKWAVIGYAHGYNNNGNKEIINSILYPGINAEVEFENSLHHQDVFLGLARGGHVEAVNHHRLRENPVHRIQTRSNILFAYAQVNNSNEVYREIREGGPYDSSMALTGYVSGGHFKEFDTLCRLYNVAPATFVSLAGHASTSQHVVQTNELINLGIALGIPQDKIVYEAFYSYVLVNNSHEISQLINRSSLNTLCYLKAYTNTYNYCVLESFYKSNASDQTLELIKHSFITDNAQDLIANLQKPEEHHLYGLSHVQDDIFRNIIIDCIFGPDHRPAIYQLTKKIADRIKQGKTYFESKDDQLNNVMNKYHFNVSQTRANLAIDIKVFSFFLRIIPGLIKIFDKDLTWMITSYLLPVDWKVSVSTDNKFEYRIAPVMTPRDMLDLANKMSAFARFADISLINNAAFKKRRINTADSTKSAVSTQVISTYLVRHGNNKKRKGTTRLEPIESAAENKYHFKDEDSTPITINYTSEADSYNAFQLLVSRNIFIPRKRVVIISQEEKQAPLLQIRNN